MEKILVDRLVIVEGKYDKIRLDNIIDATVVTTDGFGIFKNKEKAAIIKKLAETKGALILTDPDSAGYMIRGHLKGILNKADIVNVYVPSVKGKEKRKTSPSKQGLLGVEGLTDEIIRDAFIKAGAVSDRKKTKPITKQDLFNKGLLGTPGCTERRRKVLQKFGMDGELTSSALLDVLNTFTTYEEFMNDTEEL